MHFGFEGTRNLQHRVQRNGIQPLLHPKQQRLDDGQGQGKLHPESGAFAGARLHADGSFQPVQYTLHHVHANPPPRDFGDLLGSAEAGAEDEVEDLSIVQPHDFFAGRHSQFQGLGANLLGVHAAAVVGDFDDDLIALVIRMQPDDPLRRFAQFAALVRRLNAMAHRVAD